MTVCTCSCMHVCMSVYLYIVYCTGYDIYRMRIRDTISVHPIPAQFESIHTRCLKHLDLSTPIPTLFRIRPTHSADQFRDRS